MRIGPGVFSFPVDGDVADRRSMHRRILADLANRETDEILASAKQEPVGVVPVGPDIEVELVPLHRNLPFVPDPDGCLEQRLERRGDPVNVRPALIEHLAGAGGGENDGRSVVPVLDGPESLECVLYGLAVGKPLRCTDVLRRQMQQDVRIGNVEPVAAQFVLREIRRKPVAHALPPVTSARSPFASASTALRSAAISASSRSFTGL